MADRTPKTLHIDDTLVRAWVQGGQRPVAIGPIDASQAMALRHRLYRARNQMRQTSHPDVRLANLATIALRPAPGGAAGQMILYLFPTNSIIEEALKNAGLTAPEPPPLD